MNRRTERVGNLIRNTLGQILLSKIADPRIEPARTSITKVEVTPDLLTAKVYVSVMGDETQQRRTLAGLNAAAGHLQELMMRQISLRFTPHLKFIADEGFKKTLQTLEIIQTAMEEIHEKERLREPEEDDQENTAETDAENEPNPESESTGS